MSTGLWTSRLWTSHDGPLLWGASPDGIVHVHGTNELRLLEVKCPCKPLNDEELRQFVQRCTPQIQGQLECCDVENCDLVVRTAENIRVFPVRRDRVYWDQVLRPALELFAADLAAARNGTFEATPASPVALGSLDLSKEFIVSEIRGAPVTSAADPESRLLGTFPQGAAVVVEEVVLLSSGSARARISTSLGDGWVSCECVEGLQVLVLAATAPAPLVMRRFDEAYAAWLRAIPDCPSSAWLPEDIVFGTPRPKPAGDEPAGASSNETPTDDHDADTLTIDAGDALGTNAARRRRNRRRAGRWRWPIRG